MKKLFLTTIILSVLFFIGCQENSITDPLKVEPANKVQEPNLSHQGTITLEGMLDDPYPVMNSYFILNGVIEYEYTVLYLDPIPPAPQFFISLQLSISADVTYFCTQCIPPNEETVAGSISRASDDEIFISDDAGYLLEKSYPILGREDGMVLKCIFLVNSDGVSINAKWLELPDLNDANNVSL